VIQSGTSGLPAWVKKRGGRLEPFDSDKIVRGLFAATESCGRPDAFLARELADGVLLFLMRDLAGQKRHIKSSARIRRGRRQE